MAIDWQQKYEENKAAVLQEMAYLKTQEHLDEDGYPTAYAELLIEVWHWEEPGWFDFIKSLWNYRAWGWHESVLDHEYREGRKVKRYSISTAGWSGNETLIRAMERNHTMQAMFWVQSRRGGHYIYEVELNDQSEAVPESN